MKQRNKKSITASILIFALILLFSTISYAKPYTAALTGGLMQINNFFVGENYKPYAKAIDFFFFSLLFIAIYMMGARYAFKEVKKPEQVIVILLGLMTAFLLVLGGFSATIILPYIHWLLYLLLFILYWWLLKGIKSKFWRFILALLLTLLTIGLLQGLFDSLAPPELRGPGTGFFKSFSDAFKGIEFPGVPAPGVPDYLRDAFGAVTPTEVKPPTGPVTETTTPIITTKPEEKGFWENNKSWMIPLLLLLILSGLGGLGYKLGWFKRKPKEGGAPEQPTPPEELTIQKLIEEINKIIELKQKILENIGHILDKKKELTKSTLDHYHKITSDPQFDPAFLLDKESEVYKKLLQESNLVTELIKLELKLEKDLIKLRFIEELLSGTNLIFKDLMLKEGEYEVIKEILTEIKQEFRITNLREGKIVEWQEFINNYYTGSTKYGFLFKKPRTEWAEGAHEFYWQALGKMSAAFKKLIDGSQGLVPEIKAIIARFFLLTKREEEVEKELKRLTNVENLKYELRGIRHGKWKNIGDKDTNQLEEYFNIEERTFFEGALKPKVNLEMRYLQLILNILKFLESERKSFTKLQELNVATRDPADRTKWKEVNREGPDADELYYVTINEEPFKVYTNFAEGILPFKVACYVNGVKKHELPPVTKKVDVPPVVEFTSEQLGITFAGGSAPYGTPPYGAPSYRAPHIPPSGSSPYGGVGVSPYSPYGGARYITYKITVVAVSSKDTYRRHSVKSIKVYVRLGTRIGPYGPPYGVPPYGAPTTPPYGVSPYGAPTGGAPPRTPRTGRMKVLMLSFAHPSASNGISTVLYHLMPGLSSLGVEVELLTKWYGEPFFFYPAGSSSMQQFNTIDEFLATKSMNEYSFIHAHAVTFAEQINPPDPTTYWDKLLNYFKVPSAYTVHFLNRYNLLVGKWRKYQYEARKWVGDVLEPNILDSVNAIIQLNKSFVTITDKIYPGKNYSEKTVIIPNGIDLSTVTIKPKPKSGEINLLYLGRFDRNKGVYELCVAFGKLYKKYPNLKFHIVGEGAPRGKYKDFEAETMRRLLRRVKVPPDRFIIYGAKYDKEKEDIINNSDFVIIPSYTEIFCMVALEAVSHKKPLIASTVPGLKETFIDTGLAYPIDFGELRYTDTADSQKHYKLRVKKIIEAVSYCMEHKDECEQRAEMAWQFLYANSKIFDWVEIARKTKEVYESLINTNTVPRIEITIPRMSPSVYKGVPLPPGAPVTPAPTPTHPSPPPVPTTGTPVSPQVTLTFGVRGGKGRLKVIYDEGGSQQTRETTNDMQLQIIQGTVVTLEAEPENEYEFFKWSRPALRTGPSPDKVYLLMDSDKSLYVFFVPKLEIYPTSSSHPTTGSHTEFGILSLRLNDEEIRNTQYSPTPYGLYRHFASKNAEEHLEVELEGPDPKYLDISIWTVQGNVKVPHGSISWFPVMRNTYNTTFPLNQGIYLMHIIFASNPSDRSTWIIEKIRIEKT